MCYYGTTRVVICATRALPGRSYVLLGYCQKLMPTIAPMQDGELHHNTLVFLNNCLVAEPKCFEIISSVFNAGSPLSSCVQPYPPRRPTP